MEEDDHSAVITNFRVSGNEQRVNEIVSKLKFISKVKPHQKINVNSLFVRDPGWYTTAIRSVNPDENRSSTLLFLERTISDAISLYLYYRNYNNDFHRKLAELLRLNLESSKDGLNSLCRTYAEDNMYASKIETIKAMIDTEIPLA